MNTKQRLTELLRTKIISRLNEMNGEGPHSDNPNVRGGKLSGWDPDGEFEIPSVLSGGLNRLIDKGEHHPDIIDPTVSDGHFEAFGEQVHNISEELAGLHEKGMIEGVRVGYEKGNVEHITNPDELAELFDGGGDSVFAGHLRGDQGKLDHLHVSIKAD